MTTKQDIINAIIKTAKENGGKPLGMGRFEKETDISQYDCHKYWSTFGEAQREAGFIANTLWPVPHTLDTYSHLADHQSHYGKAHRQFNAGAVHC